MAMGRRNGANGRLLWILGVIFPIISSSIVESTISRSVGSRGVRIPTVGSGSKAFVHRTGLSTSTRQSFTPKINKLSKSYEKVARISIHADQAISLEKQVPTRVMLGSLLREFWPKKIGLQAKLATAMVFLVGAKVLNVQVPVLFKDVVDSLSDGLSKADMTSILPLMLLLSYGIARMSSTLFFEIRAILFASVCTNGVRKVSNRTLGSVLNMDYDFHVNRQSGALSKQIDRGHRSLDFAVRACVFTIIPTALEAVLVGSILAQKCGLVFLGVTAATMASYLLFTVIVTQWRTKFYKQVNEAENAASSQSLDSLLNFETVKYFNNEKLELKRYDKILQNYEKSYLKSTRSLSWLNFGQSLIFSTGLTIALMLAARSIMAGQNSLGDIVMIQSLLIQLSFPLNWIGSLYRELQQSAIDMGKIFQLRNTKQKVEDSETAKDLVLEKGSVDFEGVRFGYNTTREILKGVDISIPGGSKVAFVGGTGSGKSSLLRLLFRFYDPWKGSIKIDGQDLRDATAHSIRDSIGVVPQDVVLFNDNIMYNIRYGRPSATDEEVYAAARAAQVHEAISNLPDGYNTVVGERGLKLSGGEKQRLAIARLLLKNPKIVVFDEATSSLDMATEAEIMRNLQSVTEGCTTIMVAHRLETVKDADQIFVLNQGTIEEAGTHDELLARRGKYYSMWNSQRGLENVISTGISSEPSRSVVE